MGNNDQSNETVPVMPAAKFTVNPVVVLLLTYSATPVVRSVGVTFTLYALPACAGIATPTLVVAVPATETLPVRGAPET